MYFLRLLIDIVLYIIYANQDSINSMMINIIYYVYVPLRLVHSNDLNQHTCGLITSLTQRRSLLLLCSKLKEIHSLFNISCYRMFFFSKTSHSIRRSIDTSPSHQSSNNLFLSDCCVVSSWLYTCFHHDGLVSMLVDCCVMFRGRAQWCYHLSIHLVHHIARTIRPPSPNYINQ